jgi:acyl-CoA thioesterase-1
MLSISMLCVSAAEEAWVAAMKAVHAKGTAQSGSVSQIGDSITFSKAFLAGIAWGETKGAEWEVLKRLNVKDFNERKGVTHGNYSGWTAADGLAKLPAVLATEKPAIAVIMYGTNDVRKQVAVQDYEKQLTKMVELCLQAGCIPIISTIPPQLNHQDKVQAINTAIKRIAAQHHVPLIDFYDEIIQRQPDSAWNGTLLGTGDVHPTGGKAFDFSADNLLVCGYALRNYLTCRALKQVLEHCY